MTELSWLVLLFVAGFALTYALLRLLTRARRSAADRWADPDIEAEVPQPLLGQWTEGLAAQLPMTRKGKGELQSALRTAGFYRPTALLDYRALRSLFVVVALLGTGLVGLLVPSAMVRNVLLVGTTLAVLGFSVPRFYLIVRGRSRCRQIQRGLPFTIDLLSLAMSAGQNTLNALRQVSQEIAFAHPALSAELQIVQQQAALSSLGHALEQLADRVPVPEVRNLALLLIQSERLGADATNALLEFSTHHRTNMRQEAEAGANRTTFWMMFPSVCCLWVAALIVLVGPMYYEFWRQWGATSQLAKESQEKMTRVANSRPGLAPAPAPVAPPPGPPGP
jgi:tight adherence protein C